MIEKKKEMRVESKREEVLREPFSKSPTWLIVVDVIVIGSLQAYISFVCLGCSTKKSTSLHESISPSQLLCVSAVLLSR